MSKRQYMLQPCGRKAKRRQPQTQTQTHRQHLYLVVDDWGNGYSVRKIDVDAFDSDALDSDAGAADLDEEAEPLPEPPVIRFKGPHCDLWNLGAHDTSILAMPVSSDADNAFPVFDTRTLGLSLCAHPAGQKVYPKPFFASVAGKLYMMVAFSVCVLGAPPPRKEDAQWSWTMAPPAPLKSSDIRSSALHPDGRTLFVSEAKNTFSLDTENLSWTCQGNWVMPFRGQAYFDDQLDAWVGLCRHKGGVGYVCSSDVPPVSTVGSMPAWKLGKDQLFSADDKRHLGATLLYLGNNNYCLVESLLHKHFKRCRGPRHLVLYVTKFGLKYDKDGELRTTRQSARSYEMMEGHELNDLCSTPVAFWM
ncbi:unnamed protein product [Alopecurus aequalis]